MAPQEFVMISTAFSDGISLQKDGPQLTKEYTSELVLEGGKSCITAAHFVKKWVAKHFVTTLTVGDELTYFESVMFGRQTVMQNFSESISVFPHDKVNKYCSYLLYEPNSTNRRYVAGIELLPAQKFVVTEKKLKDVLPDSDAKECGEKSAINGDIASCQLINGDA